MAQFKINENRVNPGYFTDDNLNRNNRNNVLTDRTALERPRSDSEIFQTNLDYQLNYGNSISELQNTMEDMDKVTGDFYDLTGISLNMNDYIAEVDDNYLNIDYDVSGAYVDRYEGSATSYSHVQAKKEYINNYIAEYFKKNPDQKGSPSGGFRDYTYYENLRRQEIQEYERELNIQQVYNDGSSLFPSFAGAAVGIFQDPLILASIPVSIATGGTGGTLLGAVRLAALESVIAGVTETAIQARVVSYRDSLGSNYGWKEASKIIATAAGAGFVGTFGIAAIIDRTIKGYKSILNAIPGNKGKKIAKEIDRLVDEATIKDEAFADRLIKYINQQIGSLNTAEKRALLEAIPEQNKSAATKNAEQVLNGDDIVDSTNPLKDNAEGKLEHNQRILKAGNDLLNDGQVKIPEEPISDIDYTKNFDQEHNVYREVRLDPDEIEVEPDIFQFKTIEIDPETGISPKLKGIDTWDQDAANVVLVYEYADGRKVIADGHQRLGLAKRIKKLGKQKPYLLATIRREVDGHTPEETMVAAMMLNVHQGTADATDVAKILRIRPDYIEAIRGKISPRSVIWQNARGLSLLDPRAWQYYLNNKIPDNVAAAVGDLVEDGDLQIQVMEFISKNNFDNINQIRLAINDVISQGVSSKEVQDLFGTQIIKELLITERAAVLDKTLKELRKDKTVSKFLISNEKKIIEEGKNKLDSAYNKKALEESALTIERIVKLANMKGAISDELTEAAKTYKAGDQREAIQTFKKAVAEAIRSGDLDRVTPGRSERTTLSEGYTQTQPKDPKEPVVSKNLENFNDPHDGATQYARSKDEFRELEQRVVDEEDGGDLFLIDENPRTSLLDKVKNVFGKREPEKIDFSTKTLAEISDLDDDILKNQSDDLLDHPEIVALREQAEAIEQTIDTARKEGSLSKNNIYAASWQKKRNWQGIIDDLYGSGADKKEKKLIIYAGLPASGKSARANADKTKYGAIIIDSDLVKAKLPEYGNGIGAGAVHQESKIIQAQLLNRAITNNDNIILPVVGSSGNSIGKYVNLVKQFGYTVEFKYVEVGVDTAIARNVKRIHNEGRFVDPRIIKENFENIEANYNKGKELADGYEKINTEGERPVITEKGGISEDVLQSGSSNVRRSGSATEEANEIQEVLEQIDPNYEIVTRVVDDQPVTQTVGDVLKEIKTGDKLVDFLRDCPGIK